MVVGLGYKYSEKVNRCYYSLCLYELPYSLATMCKKLIKGVAITQSTAIWDHVLCTNKLNVHVLKPRTKLVSVINTHMKEPILTHNKQQRGGILRTSWQEVKRSKYRPPGHDMT